MSVRIPPDRFAYVDLIVLRAPGGELDMFARNADGVHVPEQFSLRLVPRGATHAAQA